MWAFEGSETLFKSRARDDIVGLTYESQWKCELKQVSEIPTASGSTPAKHPA